MRALIVGYGSIGQRHVRVLEELNHDIAVVSRREIDQQKSFSDIAKAVKEFDPQYAVVANETAAHRNAVEAFKKADYAKTLLIEKPLYEGSLPDDETDIANCYVAYNLRFHPLLQKLSQWLKDQEIVNAQIHAGQHLATWRPGRDYRDTYSAKAELGGGVLRDLSHELDYALWLFGPWRRIAALGGASGALGIDTDDNWNILVESERCPQLAISVNYLDATPRRYVVINTSETTAIVDFIAGTFTVGDRTVAECQDLHRDETYRRQHMAILSRETNPACSYQQGYAVLRFIEAIELASKRKSWIEAS